MDYCYSDMWKFAISFRFKESVEVRRVWGNRLGKVCMSIDRT